MGVKMTGDLGALTQALQRASRPDIKNKLGKPVGKALVSSTRERFQTSKDPTGRPWKPLATAAVKRGRKKNYKKSKGPDKGESKRLILVQTSQLKNSIASDASDTQVAVGTDVVYARIHQFGGRAGRGKSVFIPARPYLGISDGDQREIEGLAIKFLEELFQ